MFIAIVTILLYFAMGTPCIALDQALETATVETVATKPTVFVHVNLVPMDSPGVKSGQTVVVAGDRITAVGPDDDLLPPEGATVIDGTGLYLVPGLVDAHMHLDTLVEARPNFGDAPLYLSYGVTTVFNLRGQPAQLEWKNAIQEGRLVAPNLYTSGEFLNEPRVVTPSEVEQDIAQQARDGYDMIKYRQIIDNDTWETLTTVGLSEESYLRMNEAARRIGIPLIGHAPTNLGLEVMLQARQSLAHIGEFYSLYFLPVAPEHRKYVLAALGGFALLCLVLLGWTMSWVVRRVSKKDRPSQGFAFLRIRRLTSRLTLMTLITLILFVLFLPGSFLCGNVPLLVLYSLVAMVSVILAILLIAWTLQLWRETGVPWGLRIQATIIALASLALILAVFHWVPISWRSTAGNIAEMSEKCKQSGIFIASTLVVYETGFNLERGLQQALINDPAFRYLPESVRDQWREPIHLLPGLFVSLFENYPAFTRSVAGALHRAGVPILAGTDAMGFSLIIPGESMHRELEMLIQSGFTPWDALEAATLNPARFLGLENEFGSISPGKRADLLLVKGNPLDDLSCLEQPLGVMVRGLWLDRHKLDEMLLPLAQ
ncbi:amidohydrolase family protein [bacterium]|nr:amidohydrolase family protein [bacterium]